MTVTKIRRKYCDQARKMIVTLRRGETKKWANVAATVASLEAHYARCKDGCGRDLTGEVWPPP